MPSRPSPPSAAPAPATSPAPQAAPLRREPGGLASDRQRLPIDAPEETTPMPHERDESPDRAAPAGNEPSQRAVGERARRDLEEGREDTDRGPATERVYERVKRRER